MNSPSFAQESASVSQDKIVLNVKELTEMIDLYFEEMISFQTRIKNTPQQNQTPEDAAKKQFLEETRLTIIDALKEIRSPILEIANKPESLEVSEALKHQYNLALVKAFLPRYQKSNVGIISKVFGTVQPQYVPEIISRADALQLMFTDFATNEATKDSMNLSHRLSEVIKTHNAIASQVNSTKQANIYQIYPTNLKITTSTQEAAFYEAIAKNASFKPSISNTTPIPQDVVLESKSPSTLETKKTSPDFYKMITTCFGLFAI